MSVPSEKTSATSEEAKPRGVRRRIQFQTWRVLAAAFGLAAVAGLMWPIVWGESGRKGTGRSTLAASTNEASTLHIDVIQPVKGGVRRLTIQPGSVHAFESVDLYAKASGFLKSQRVDIGSSIRRGEPLAEIDAPELQGAVDAADAAVEQAKAKCGQAVSRVATAEADRLPADASVTQAESDIARLAARRSLSEKQFERIKDLHARRAVDGKLMDEQQQEFESAQAAERTGYAAVKTARAETASAAAKVLETKADVAETRASLRLAGARLERIKVLASYTKISAPFDGVITRRNFHPGAFIRSAADGHANRPDARGDPGARPRCAAARRRRQGHRRGRCTERQGVPGGRRPAGEVRGPDDSNDARGSGHPQSRRTPR